MNCKTIIENSSYSDKYNDDTRHWGTNIWLIIHLLTYNDDISKELFYKFLNNIIPIICVTCRSDFRDNIEKIKLNQETNLFNLSVILHNMVNKKLNKKIYTYNEAKEIYRCYLTNNTNIKDKITEILLYQFHLTLKLETINEKNEYIYNLYTIFTVDLPSNHMLKISVK